MIRRHAAGFRALLMAVDASLAAVVLVGLSAWRFGPDWAVLWVQVVPEPWAFLALYLVGWLIALTANGLYRPRARWSLRAEAMGVIRATVVMAIATTSVLFLFKLPDVSRLFLLILFPTQAIVTIAYRAALRWFFAAARGRGRNMHYVLVLGAGVRVVAFARKLEDHSELGLRIVGLLEDPSGQVQEQSRWPVL